MQNLISVIVPVYNVEPYLRRCVDSVCSQTYERLEIILVDDGSTDGSGSVCDELGRKDARIRVVHKRNGGLSSARNAGLDIAEGDFIGFVDGDDYVDPNMYRLLVNALDSQEANVISNVMFVHVDDAGCVTPSSVTNREDEDIAPKDYLMELLLHQGDVSVCTKLFPKRLIGSLRFEVGKLNEDLLFMLDLVTKLDGIRFVGTVAYYYFARSGSTSSGYGRAVRGMVGNSLVAYDFACREYPDLEPVAKRFAIYQHMAYLLLVPDDDAKTEQCANALAFIRDNLRNALVSRYLTSKQKAIICGLCVAPRAMAHVYQRKRVR